MGAAPCYPMQQGTAPPVRSECTPSPSHPLQRGCTVSLDFRAVAGYRTPCDASSHDASGTVSARFSADLQRALAFRVVVTCGDCVCLPTLPRSAQGGRRYSTRLAISHPRCFCGGVSRLDFQRTVCTGFFASASSLFGDCVSRERRTPNRFSAPRIAPR